MKLGNVLEHEGLSDKVDELQVLFDEQREKGREENRRISNKECRMSKFFQLQRFEIPCSIFDILFLKTYFSVHLPPLATSTTKLLLARVFLSVKETAPVIPLNSLVSFRAFTIAALSVEPARVMASAISFIPS